MDWIAQENAALEKLQNSALLKTSSFIDGKFEPGERHFEVQSPSTRNPLLTVAGAGKNTAERAIDGAESAFETWRKTTPENRGLLLEKLAQAMEEEADTLALILTLEHGKPLAEAAAEIRYATSFVKFFAAEAVRGFGEVIPSSDDRQLLVYREPIGVGAGITPWNFPSAMITRKLAPALAAGCSFVLKPAAQTPLSALALAALVARVGFPDGVFQVVVGEDAAAISEPWMRDFRVRKLSFTGSTAVGKMLYENAAPTLKRVGLELGGNAPFIVFDDADLDLAIDALKVAKFRNGGQSCVAANRVFVHENIWDTFVENTIQMVSKMNLGHGLDPQASLGPLIDERALTKLERLMNTSNAKCVLGGKKAELSGLDGHFFESTVLLAEKDDSILTEEVFGPVLTLTPFSEDSEVITRANNTKYGLASYVFTQSYQRAFQVSKALQFGMVGVNTGLISNARAPFGGFGESGFGREGSKHGLHEWTQMKYVSMAGLSS